MKRNTQIGLLLAGLLAVFFVGLLCDNGIREGFIGIPVIGIPFEAISMVLFEKYGAVLLILGGLMFGAIIAGVAISKEEEDE